MNPNEFISKINCKDDFAKFVGELINDLRSNPDSWENNRLDIYFEAMKSWVEDMDGWEKNQNIKTSEMSSWRLMAHILYASRMYE